jgi:hypothetical protein
VSLFAKVFLGLVALFIAAAVPLMWLEDAFPAHRSLRLAPSIAEVFAVTMLIISLALWYIPKRDADAFRADVSDKGKLAELQLTSRTSITQAVGGVALIITLALTAYQANGARRSANENVRLTEQGQ